MSDEPTLFEVDTTELVARLKARLEVLGPRNREMGRQLREMDDRHDAVRAQLDAERQPLSDAVGAVLDEMFSVMDTLREMDVNPYADEPTGLAAWEAWTAQRDA